MTQTLITASSILEWPSQISINSLLNKIYFKLNRYKVHQENIITSITEVPSVNTIPNFLSSTHPQTKLNFCELKIYTESITFLLDTKCDSN